MAVTFACPECGTEVVLAPNAVGRKTRCTECMTLVEVPYFHRPTRSRPSSNAKQWACVAIALALAVIASCGVYWIVSGNIRAERQRVFSSLLSEAKADAAIQDWTNALRRADAALDIARDGSTIDAERAIAARALRDQWAIAYEERQSMERIREAEGSLAVARAGLGNTKPNLAGVLDACEAAAVAAQKVESDEGRTLVNEAREIAASVIRARGVVLQPVAGTYLGKDLGVEYAKAYWPPLAHALDAHGFVAAREQSPLASLWVQHAPFQLQIEIKETLGPTYLSSALLTTRIDARIWLRRDSREVWKAGLTARTRVPSSRFSAFESGYLATATKRDPELEKRLHDDAFDVAVGQLGAKLSTMPDWAPSTSFGSP